MNKSVLSSYRTLIRTSKRLFREDLPAFLKARERIRLEYTKNANVADPEAIEALVREAKEADVFLRNSVVQAVKTDEVLPAEKAADRKAAYYVRMGKDTRVGELVTPDQARAQMEKRAAKLAKKQQRQEEEHSAVSK